MNFKKCVPALCLCAAFTACTEDMALGEPGEPTVITASSGKHANPASSRTAVGGIAGDGSLVMQWTPGDKIGVFGNDTRNALFTSANTEPVDNAPFSGYLQGGDVPVAAYYPYDESVVDRTAISANIPAAQLYAGVNSVAQYDIKAAVAEEGTSGYDLSFKQMATLLRLDISLTDTEGLLADETLKSIEMTVQGAVLAGTFTYSLDNLDAGLQGVETSSTLRLDMQEPPKMTEQLTAYAVVAPGEHKGKTVDFVLITDRHKVTFSTTLLTDFLPGVFYDLPLNAEVLANNNAEVTELPDGENKEETANCYMITTTGEHSFCATQIGNGDKGIIPDAGFHVTSAAISPKSAKLLWQDVENFISDVSLADDGRVYYTANTNCGNAVIAVYSGPDCTGDILWSWHIWGVGDELPSDEIYTNRAGVTFNVMDRTLGAHGVNSYYATLYQWGRKDPVPNSSTYYVDGTATDIEKTYPVLEDDEATILTGVQNPGMLINRPSNNNTDWLPEKNIYLWGDEKILNSTNYPGYKWSAWLDGVTADEQNGWSNQKTIYDPSPVGYRVASKFTWTGFVKNADGKNSTSSSELEYINYVKYEDGYYFMKNSADAAGAYYPMTGSRGATTGTLWVGGNAPYMTRNYTATYWSASPGKTAGQAHSLSLTPYDASELGSSSKNSVNTIGGNYNANAFAVRCVREE